MTLAAPLESAGMRDVRERIRAVVQRVEDGVPLVILQHGQPAAVMIRFDEAERWARIERALSALHALDLYPEVARDTSELGPLVLGSVRADGAAVRALVDVPREIVAPLRTVTITEARERLAAYLDEIQSGRMLTLVVGGRLAVTLISPREYDRLRALSRVVSWFRAAGLDLGAADEADISAFVQEYRSRVAASGSAEPAAS